MHKTRIEYGPSDIIIKKIFRAKAGVMYQENGPGLCTIPSMHPKTVDIATIVKKVTPFIFEYLRGSDFLTGKREMKSALVSIDLSIYLSIYIYI